jgi:hypothetical protein
MAIPAMTKEAFRRACPLFGREAIWRKARERHIMTPLKTINGPTTNIPRPESVIPCIIGVTPLYIEIPTKSMMMPKATINVPNVLIRRIPNDEATAGAVMTSAAPRIMTPTPHTSPELVYRITTIPMSLVVDCARIW